MPTSPSPAPTAPIAAAGAGKANPAPAVAPKDLFKLAAGEKLAALEESAPNPTWVTLDNTKVVLAVIEVDNGVYKYVELRTKTADTELAIVRDATTPNTEYRLDGTDPTDGLVFEARILKKRVPGVGLVYSGRRYKLAWDKASAAPVATHVADCEDEQTRRVRAAKIPICDEPANWVSLVKDDGSCCCRTQEDLVHFSWEKPTACLGSEMMGECVEATLCKPKK